MQYRHYINASLLVLSACFLPLVQNILRNTNTSSNQIYSDMCDCVYYCSEYSFMQDPLRMEGGAQIRLC